MHAFVSLACSLSPMISSYLGFSAILVRVRWPWNKNVNDEDAQNNGTRHSSPEVALKRQLQRPLTRSVAFGVSCRGHVRAAKCGAHFKHQEATHVNKTK